MPHTTGAFSCLRNFVAADRCDHSVTRVDKQRESYLDPAAVHGVGGLVRQRRSVGRAGFFHNQRQLPPLLLVILYLDEEN
ncbi:hypothetical protein AND_004389 [Anopheles darlingi]|uniref:Uncharacterized protein n=1 Tax=Anopheles darlingi TaxID=43151 RepID=W5JKQ5_ANODA|nr:hypothetical protein AND_004389 [Anopheles darlingi]